MLYLARQGIGIQDFDREDKLLSARRTSVLNALVNEYIKSTLPVSSSVLAKSYLSGVSSATIRNELFGLEHAGLAFSPHTSAGRIPTNDGYRIFVNLLLLKPLAAPSATAEKLESGLSGESSAPAPLSLLVGDIRQLVDSLSAATSLLALYSDGNPQHAVVIRGLSRLAQQPEFSAPHLLLPILELTEDNDRLYRLLSTSIENRELSVRVGVGESGVFSRYSLISRHLPGQLTSILAVLGPTRMDYRRALSSLDAASEAATALNARS
jgi:heat-inducible transcriptional repressor